MKILVADDEDYTREGLIEAVDWEKHGIDEIMQAVNGAEAIKIAKWFRPDIILTDVKMPKMDGIEFATKMLELNTESKIIFMSGYMEIQYLQSAIRLAAIDYIEKPIDLKVLDEALGKAVGEVKQKRKIQEKEEEHQEIQKQKLINLLCSKDFDRKTVEKLAEESGFSLNNEYQFLIIKTPKGGEQQEKQTEVMELLLESMGWNGLFQYNSEKKELEVLLSYPQREQYRLSPFYQRVLEQITDCRLAIGMPVSEYHNIYNSYRMALMAMNMAFYNDEIRLLQVEDGIRQRNYIEPGIYGEFLQLLSNHPEEIKEWFEQLFLRLRQKQYYYKEHVYTLLVSLMTAVYKQYPGLYEKQEAIRQEEQIQKYIMSLESLTEMRIYVEETLSSLELMESELSSYSRVIRGVIGYIESHYQEEDLSITEIAEHLHFSSAYLNVIFKQEMKCTLKQYLSNYRLKKAKQMLEKEYDKITEIAVKCGYANANYFAKVFKEATGVTPAEWRSGQKGENIEK